MSAEKPNPTAFDYTTLTEAEVRAALVDPDNPITIEFVRLVRSYFQKFGVDTERSSLVSQDFFYLVKPHTAIEALAVRRASEAIEQELEDPSPAFRTTWSA